ncbi:hypothetical protein M885DRAFT_560085 [Pelagophyceae sp. CCMP2097]|nr:hypothetical protein M885DRAFT_560085 [Pelagophyceae sp. CCMP2097]
MRVLIYNPEIDIEYLASLLTNGDLETTKLGLISSKCAFAQTFTWVGATSTEFAAAFLPLSTEHRFNTRIRSPECCNADQMATFANFGREGRFGAEELGAAAAFFADQNNGHNDFLQSGPDVLIRVWGLFLAIFDVNGQLQKICDAATLHWQVEDCPLFAVAFVPVPMVELGAAETFAIIANAGISTVPDSVITGEVGECFARERRPAASASAAASSRTPLAPGVYKWTETIRFDDRGITLDGFGNENAVFILHSGWQTTGDVIAASNARVTLKRGFKAVNIFWQVAGYVECGVGSHLEGIFLPPHAAFYALREP